MQSTPPTTVRRLPSPEWRSLGGLAAVGAVVAVGGLAFTASNTVPASKAGDGSGTVSGYVVSSVHYGLATSDPSTFDSVTFTLDSSPASGSTIKVKVGGSWYSCTNTAADVTCDTSGGSPSVQPTDSLQVVVAD